MTTETAAQPALTRGGLRRILAALCLTEITSWGVLYHGLAVAFGLTALGAYAAVVNLVPLLTERGVSSGGSSSASYVGGGLGSAVGGAVFGFAGGTWLGPAAAVLALLVLVLTAGDRPRHGHARPAELSRAQAART